MPARQTTFAPRGKHPPESRAQCIPPLSSFRLLDLIRRADFDRALSIGDGRQFQDRDKLLRLAIRPSVSAFCLRMAGQIEYFHVALPDRLALKYLVDWHGVDVRGLALVQMLHYGAKAVYVFFARHHSTIR